MRCREPQYRYRLPPNGSLVGDARSTPIEHLHDDSELGHAIQGKYLTVEALTKEGVQIVQIGLHLHVASPVLGDVE
jgi:hypothetical protein